MARTLNTEEFAAEAERRLVDTYEVMRILGVRSRDTVRKRIANGTLPPPILVKANSLSLWDRDSIPADKEA